MGHPHLKVSKSIFSKEIKQEKAFANSGFITGPCSNNSYLPIVFFITTNVVCLDARKNFYGFFCTENSSERIFLCSRIENCNISYDHMINHVVFNS